MAAHSGLETIPAYAEEAKSYRVVVLGWLAAIATGGVLYAMMSWSYESWLGPDRLAQAGDPANSPVVLLHEVFGAGIADMALGLFVTSVLAAACSLGGTVARYTFAMARESVLPTWCGKTSRRDAPLGGSIVQAVLAGITLIVMTAAGMRPETIFTWLSTIGALCVLILLTASSWSALNFFKRGLGRGASNPLTQRVLPFIGGICGLIGLGFTGSSLGGLLGAAPGSPLPWLVAVPIGGFALIGLSVGAWLKTARPQVYDLLGLGTPKPELVLDNDLANIRI
jgi:amino acid transporter